MIAPDRGLTARQQLQLDSQRAWLRLSNVMGKENDTFETLPGYSNSTRDWVGVRTLKTEVERILIVEEVLRAEIFRSGERRSILHNICRTVILWFSETGVDEAKDWMVTTTMNRKARRGQYISSFKRVGVGTSATTRFTQGHATGSERHDGFSARFKTTMERKPELPSAPPNTGFTHFTALSPTSPRSPNYMIALSCREPVLSIKFRPPRHHLLLLPVSPSATMRSRSIFSVVMVTVLAAFTHMLLRTLLETRSKHTSLVSVFAIEGKHCVYAYQRSVSLQGTTSESIHTCQVFGIIQGYRRADETGRTQL
ncbi:uncharacterized protein EV420DRAFT_1486389 [Desarmillaria tabescens]|uniref:Uncharacterized protein n=1 Tax=Armillaria tabescens TaxID=1929756 RepID=A0AA39MM17_ARMTA|nr:uncharacterized protein EV420DRAFT_1486389 [Desarmillaria tabescens]KAK0439292.1 hypothetical protein EV420DRAFT_1486389 [Desarmillaria tabescens]